MAAAAVLAFFATIGSSAPALAAEPDIVIWVAPSAHSTAIWAAPGR
ncbi:hypothetical protein ACFRMQ_11025 [Kitasatospora sp. NPDC056783]